MTKRSAFIAVLLSVIAFNLPLMAGELDLPAAPASVEVPGVDAPVPDKDALLKEYRDYSDALQAFSDIAFVAPVGSPSYVEASASGQYLRARVEELGAVLKAQGLRPPAPERANKSAKVPFGVLSELDDVFGFFTAPGSRGGTRGVPVKAGYCQVNYVKNNVPFLVQYDGFLKKGEIILTFDDGPGPLTDEVSGAMRDAKAPSVFFVLGRNLAGEAGKGHIRTEAADGNYVAVHGYNHAAAGDKPFTAMSVAEAVKQIGGVKETIKDASGQSTRLFRPPYGIMSVDQLKAVDSELGLIPVGWTIDTLDWSTKDPEALFEKTVAMIQQRGKGIVLMHDIHPQSRTAAKRLVKWLADNGYTVVSPERLVKAYRGE